MQVAPEKQVVDIGYGVRVEKHFWGSVSVHACFVFFTHDDLLTQVGKGLTKTAIFNAKTTLYAAEYALRKSLNRESVLYKYLWPIIGLKRILYEVITNDPLKMQIEKASRIFNSRQKETLLRIKWSEVLKSTSGANASFGFGNWGTEKKYFIMFMHFHKLSNENREKPAATAIGQTQQQEQPIVTIYTPVPVAAPLSIQRNPALTHKDVLLQKASVIVDTPAAVQASVQRNPALTTPATSASSSEPKPEWKPSQVLAEEDDIVDDRPKNPLEEDDKKKEDAADDSYYTFDELLWYVFDLVLYQSPSPAPPSSSPPVIVQETAKPAAVTLHSGEMDSTAGIPTTPEVAHLHPHSKNELSQSDGYNAIPPRHELGGPDKNERQQKDPTEIEEERLADDSVDEEEEEEDDRNEGELERERQGEEDQENYGTSDKKTGSMEVVRNNEPEKEKAKEAQTDDKKKEKGAENDTAVEPKELTVPVNEKVPEENEEEKVKQQSKKEERNGELGEIKAATAPAGTLETKHTEPLLKIEGEPAKEAKVSGDQGTPTPTPNPSTGAPSLPPTPAATKSNSAPPVPAKPKTPQGNTSGNKDATSSKSDNQQTKTGGAASAMKEPPNPPPKATAVILNTNTLQPSSSPTNKKPDQATNRQSPKALAPPPLKNPTTTNRNLGKEAAINKNPENKGNGGGKKTNQTQAQRQSALQSGNTANGRGRKA